MIVADASPLIALAQIRRLDLLASLYGEVQIPAAVQQEVSRELGGDLPTWLRLRAVSDTQLAATLGLHLDQGEAEAITIAIDLGVPLLIDEKDRTQGCSGARHQRGWRAWRSDTRETGWLDCSGRAFARRVGRGRLLDGRIAPDRHLARSRRVVGPDSSAEL